MATGCPGGFEPLSIEGIIVEEVGAPRHDGSRGSALYAVPFRLSRQAPPRWGELFTRNWDRPPQFTTMHRPGIARVYGDRLVLDGTTVEEVEKTHRKTLKLVLDVTNEAYAAAMAGAERTRQAEAEQLEEHRQRVQDVADRIRFDD